MGVFKRNYKRPKLWIALTVIAVVVIFLFLYIDSNFFYFSRIEKRIDVLEKVIALDQQAINGNEIFAKEYQDILQKIEQQNEHSIKSVKDILAAGINEAGDILTSGIQEIGNYFRAENVVQDSRPLFKFLTGGIWFLILTLCVPFMKSVFESPGERIAAFVIMLVLTLMVGGICSVMPTIFSPWVNYIGIPIIELIGLGILFSKV